MEKGIYYFDINSYFKSQVELLSNKNPQIKKIITKNGVTEEKILSNVDWQKELLSFTESDINKPSWKDSYNTDTTFFESGFVIKYIAQEKNLSTRLISVEQDENQNIKKIEIIKEPYKKIYTAKSTLIYIPDSLYSISVEQTLILFKKDFFIVTSTIIK